MIRVELQRTQVLAVCEVSAKTIDEADAKAQFNKYDWNDADACKYYCGECGYEIEEGSCDECD